MKGAVATATESESREVGCLGGWYQISITLYLNAGSYSKLRIFCTVIFTYNFTEDIRKS